MNGIKFCNCGSPQIVIEKMHEILKILKEPINLDIDDKLVEAVGNDLGSYWLWLYVLDQLGLTDHGVSVGCSWLSPKGESLLEKLNECKDESDCLDLAAQILV